MGRSGGIGALLLMPFALGGIWAGHRIQLKASRELLLKVFRARHAIRHGTIAVATDPDPLEKAAVMEMLYLRGDDK